MQNKNNRLKYRTNQKQKLRHRTLMIIAVSCTVCLTVAVTIFLNLSRVDKSMAAVSIYVVPEEKPVVEMTLDAPVIRQLPVIGPNTIMVKELKAEPEAANDHNN